MDIQYLLFLQSIRDQTPDWINQFFMWISEVTISPIVMLIPAIFFWCICKREGVFLLFGYGMGNLAKDLIKLTACVYRPWIRDPSVNSLLKASATGYSFPSGHTTSAVVLYGGIGVYLRQYRK